MSKVTAANYSAPAFTWGTTLADIFAVSDLESFAQAMDAHDHTAGKGLAVGRVSAAGLTNVTITTPTISAPTVTGRLVASTVGVTSKPLLNFVPCIPALVRTNAGLVGASATDVALPGGVPSSAVAVALLVTVTRTGTPGVVDVSHLAAEGTYAIILSATDDAGSGVVACVSATPCTVGITVAASQTVTPTLVVSGWYEPA